MRELYENVTMKDVVEGLPDRSMSSILGKARCLNLKSYHYLTRIYSDSEVDFLRNNYLNLSNDELAKKLGRAPGAISQRLYTLGLYRPREKTHYESLNRYVRSNLTAWKYNIFKKSNFECAITGKKRDLVVHHCRSLNLLILEAIDVLGFKVKDNFDEYNLHELESFVDTVMELQEHYKEYICISSDLHILFHKNYGFGNNTIEQWDDFVEKYNNGYYKLAS